MRTGLDRVLVGDVADERVRALLAEPLALLTNDAALSGRFEHGRVELLAAGIRISRLFGPEHGISASGADGSPQHDGADPLTGLPVTSLYGERFAPATAQLEGLGAVLVDLPDIGCRFYTYAWTMSHVMEACADAGTPVIVLDRPNPLGGLPADVEGPMLDEERCASFLGRWSVPIRHGLTLGELARHWQRERMPGLQLHVVAADGWRRHEIAAAGRRPWVPTSPAMPSAEAALLYPGLGLLEGVGVSEGRGTALPFRVAGAPWVDGRALAARLRRDGVPGAAVTPYSFAPESGPFAGERCGGVLFTVTDAAAVRPVRLGLSLLSAFAELWPERLVERRYPTAANPSGAGHLDRLLGVPGVFAALRSGELSALPLDPPAGWFDAMEAARLY